MTSISNDTYPNLPTLSLGYRIERIIEGSGFHTLNGVAFGPDGRLFAASMSGESLFALDLASGQIETVVGPPRRRSKAWSRTANCSQAPRRVLSKERVATA